MKRKQLRSAAVGCFSFAAVLVILNLPAIGLSADRTVLGELFTIPG